MEEKSHGEKIEVFQENGDSTGRDFVQGCIEVQVIQLRRPRRKPKTTWISIVKKNLNEMNLSCLEAENLAIENNDWVRIIKRYFDIWLTFRNFCNI